MKGERVKGERVKRWKGERVKGWKGERVKGWKVKVKGEGEGWRGERVVPISCKETLWTTSLLCCGSPSGQFTMEIPGGITLVLAMEREWW